MGVSERRAWRDEAEDAVTEAGLDPVQTETGDPLHFGLIGRNGAGDTEVLAYLAPERDGLLEYDLTRLVAALANPERPVIAVATDLASLRAALEPASQGGEARLGVSFIGEELARRYDIACWLRTSPPCRTRPTL